MEEAAASLFIVQPSVIAPITSLASSVEQCLKRITSPTWSSSLNFGLRMNLSQTLTPLLFQYQTSYFTQKLIDTRLGGIYFDFMTYYSTSNMTPITCSAHT
jgi:hypothetical protein